MKILQINSVYGFGSTGRIVIDISNKLVEQGNESFICYGRGGESNQLNTFKMSSNLDNKAHGILTRVTDQHAFGSKRETEKLIRIIKKFDPDIIHLHNLHGYYLNIEILFHYLRDTKKPVVWTLHDCWAFTGHCAHFDYIKCNRWKTGCYQCSQKKEYPKSYFRDSSVRNYSRKKELFTSVENMTMVTPSSWLANLVGESFLANYPVKVINNGVNLDVFSPRENLKREEYGLKDKFIILGVASVWGERKGLPTFVDLAKMLPKEYQIILVGISEKQKKALPNNIIGITRTNDIQELAQYYSMADVFMNPTLEDTFPTTNIEALACGTPVITFETGGSPESLDESCGIVVEKDNINKLYEAVCRLKKNPINSVACLKKAQLYNKEDKYREYLSLYEQILKK